MNVRDIIIDDELYEFTVYRACNNFDVYEKYGRDLTEAERNLILGEYLMHDEDEPVDDAEFYKRELLNVIKKVEDKNQNDLLDVLLSDKRIDEQLNKNVKTRNTINTSSARIWGAIAAYRNGREFDLPILITDIETILKETI